MTSKKTIYWRDAIASGHAIYKIILSDPQRKMYGFYFECNGKVILLEEDVQDNHRIIITLERKKEGSKIK